MIPINNNINNFNMNSLNNYDTEMAKYGNMMSEIGVMMSTTNDPKLLETYGKRMSEIGNIMSNLIKNKKQMEILKFNNPIGIFGTNNQPRNFTFSNQPTGSFTFSNQPSNRPLFNEQPIGNFAFSNQPTGSFTFSNQPSNRPLFNEQPTGNFAFSNSSAFNGLKPKHNNDIPVFNYNPTYAIVSNNKKNILEPEETNSNKKSKTSEKPIDTSTNTSTNSTIKPNEKKFKFTFSINKNDAKIIEDAIDNNKTGALNIKINSINNNTYKYEIFINAKTHKIAILKIANELLEIGIDEHYIDKIFTTKIIKPTSIQEAK